MAKNKITNRMIAAGVAGAAGVAAAAVGAYWLYGTKKSKEYRKVAVGWINKARTDLTNAVRKMKKVDKEAYLRTVDRIMKKYDKENSVRGDIVAVTREMRAAWPHIHKAIKPAKRVAKKAAHKISKGK